MKIRNGFVSNSSSSSFICDFCGRTETGYDLSIEEAEMGECVNGHYFCLEEAVEKFDEAFFDDSDNYYGIPKQHCPVCNRREEMQKDSEYNEYKRLYEKFGHVDPEGRKF